MDGHTFRVLEYEQVREIIAEKTTCIYGREKIEKRYPLKDVNLIEQIHVKIKEALSILESKDSFTVGELKDIREYLRMAGKQIPLRCEEILAVADVLASSRLLKQYLSDREALYPALHAQSESLIVFKELEKLINKTISEEGRILDNATENLSRIRSSIEVLNNRIHGQLDRFLKNPEFSKMLQEPIVTRREHRYVLPVKQEYRSVFPGLVLDSSASGATLFMEPLAVLKMTNEIKYLHTEEEREEEQIRLKLSQKIAEASNDILRSIDFLGDFDSFQASARFMIDNKAVLPKILKKPKINLLNARHPLLGEKAVPIHMHIGDQFSGLIITGPNTGGKTVSLKTTGLLTLMAMSGLPITADADSEVGLFTGVFADIGDEQSISQNLSTFSSHITNITRILFRTGKRSLVLLDEIGAGTDPSEGVALASGLLDFLAKRGAKVIATTHYNQLKDFASRRGDFKNAAVQFDEESLKPTYQISIGLPGRSCALKIAKRLGMPDEIIKAASEILGSSYFQIDSILTEIDQEKSRIEKERREAEETREEMEKLREEYSKKLDGIESEQEGIIEKTRREMENLISEVSRELDEARKEWRKSLKEYKSHKKDRTLVQEDEKKIRSSLEKTIERLKGLQKKQEKEEKKPILPVFAEGALVNVTTMDKRGPVSYTHLTLPTIYSV